MQRQAPFMDGYDSSTPHNYTSDQSNYPQQMYFNNNTQPPPPPPPVWTGAGNPVVPLPNSATTATYWPGYPPPYTMNHQPQQHQPQQYMYYQQQPPGGWPPQPPPPPPPISNSNRRILGPTMTFVSDQLPPPAPLQLPTPPASKQIVGLSSSTGQPNYDSGSSSTNNAPEADMMHRKPPPQSRLSASPSIDYTASDMDESPDEEAPRAGQDEEQTLQELYEDVDQISLPQQKQQPSLESLQDESRGVLQQAKETLSLAEQDTSKSRELALQQARDMLREAQARVQHLKRLSTAAASNQQAEIARTDSYTPSYGNGFSSLPPITALKTPVIISNISEGPQDLVRYDPEEWEVPVLAEDGEDDDEEKEGHHDMQQPFAWDDELWDDPVDVQNTGLSPVLEQSKKKSEALQKNLLLLKRKLELKRKAAELKAKRQRTGEAEPAKEDSAMETADGVASEVQSKLSREELIKRQGELQQSMDAAYWRQLVVKQKKLLEKQQQKVRETERSLESCKLEIQEEKSQFEDCDLKEKQWRVRLQKVEQLQKEETKKLLASRKALHEARSKMPQND